MVIQPVVGTFLKYVQQFVPEAKENYAGITMPKQDVTELATKCMKEKPKAKAQNVLWAPVSKASALKYFNDPNDEGAYFLAVTLEEQDYEFCINANGETIEYVVM